MDLSTHLSGTFETQRSGVPVNKFKVGSCWKEVGSEGTSMFQVTLVQGAYGEVIKVMADQVYLPREGLYSGKLLSWTRVTMDPSELDIAEPFPAEKFNMLFSLGQCVSIY